MGPPWESQADENALRVNSECTIQDADAENARHADMVCILHFALQLRSSAA
jgi:hypothetical protein